MKQLLFILVGLCLIGCSKKESAPAGTAQAPVLTNPIGPVCSQVPFHLHGEFAPPTPRLTVKKVFIPNFDRSKDDTLDIVYKCWNCDTWNPVLEGGSSGGVVYSVSGSTVSLSYQHVGEWEWEINALVNECS